MTRIAVQVYPQHCALADIRRAFLTAEELGADRVYTWDHFFPLFGDSEGAHFECFTMLAALAEATSIIRFGPLVACNSYRNPELLADMARTIDHVSGGRFILGIGSGWFERDYAEYGYEFGTAPSRLRDLAAAIPRMKTRLGKLNPPPMGPLPMMIGGAGEKVTLRLTAEHADIWHGFARDSSGKRSPAEQVRHKNAVLDAWCAKVGRDPKAIDRSIGVDAASLDLADAIADAGADEISVGVAGPEFDFSTVKRWLAWRDARGTG